MRRAIAALAAIAGLAPAVAAADTTFEAQAQGAIRVARVDDLVWALTSPCERGNDTEQRQCRQLRDRKAKQLAEATLVVEAEPSAVVIGPWDKARKSVPITLAACVRCEPVEVEGKPWVVAGTGATAAGGKVRGATLYDNAKPFSDEAAAAAWLGSLGGVRVELVVKVAPEPQRRAAVAGKQALQLQIVAWRVVNACEGSIVIASAPSGSLPPDKRACTPAAPK